MRQPQGCEAQASMEQQAAALASAPLLRQPTATGGCQVEAGIAANNREHKKKKSSPTTHADDKRGRGRRSILLASQALAQTAGNIPGTLAATS